MHWAYRHSSRACISLDDSFDAVSASIVFGDADLDEVLDEALDECFDDIETSETSPPSGAVVLGLAVVFFSGGIFCTL